MRLWWNNNMITDCIYGRWFRAESSPGPRRFVVTHSFRWYMFCAWHKKKKKSPHTHPPRRKFQNGLLKFNLFCSVVLHKLQRKGPDRTRAHSLATQNLPALGHTSVQIYTFFSVAFRFACLVRGNVKQKKTKTKQRKVFIYILVCKLIENSRNVVDRHCRGRERRSKINELLITSTLP